MLHQIAECRTCNVTVDAAARVQGALRQVCAVFFYFSWCFNMLSHLRVKIYDLLQDDGSDESDSVGEPTSKSTKSAKPAKTGGGDSHDETDATADALRKRLVKNMINI